MKRQKALKWLALAMAGAMTLGGCGEAKTKSSSSEGTETKTEDVSDEVYVWACQHNSLPLFVNNDYIGMDLIAEQLGVTVK